MYRLKQLTLLLGDLLALYFGLFLAMLVRHRTWPEQSLIQLIKPMSVLFLLAAIILFITGLYDLYRAKNTKAFYSKIITSAIIWLFLGVLFFYINTYNNVSPKTILFLNALFGFGLVSIWRWFYNRFVSTAIWRQNIIFAGLTDEVRQLVKILAAEPQRGYAVKGVITNGDDTLPQESAWKNIALGRSINEIKDEKRLKHIDLIIISPQATTNQELLKELYTNLFKGVSIVDLENFYEELTGRIPPFTFSESWFIANLQEQNKKIYDRAKMIFDYLFALLMGIFFLVTFPLLALIIKLSSPGPIFFKQTRTGKLGKEFTVYKYRTMKALSADGSAETSGPQFASANDQRITTVGKFMRRTRLDEIPQFFNILRREMSVIGPRPERPEFVRQTVEKTPYYSLRHLVKPGLTGWAQIKHGYSGTIDENLIKLEYDLYYIKNRGLLLDLAITLRTINILAKLAGR